jgi:hypothetical protein
MANKRYFSEKYVNKTIDRIDALYAKNMDNLVPMPDALLREENAFLKKEVLNYLENRVAISYVDGFWNGYSLREGMKD